MNLITTTQLAQKLQVTTGCIRQWVGEGRIKPAAQLPSGDYLWRPNTTKPRPLREAK